MRDARRVPVAAVLTLVAVLGATGCSTTPNPSFPLTVVEANDAIRDMESAPTPAERPVVILGGIMDPGIAVKHISKRFDRVLDEDSIIPITFAFEPTFDQCREKVIEAVDAVHPSLDPNWTTEVDVIAVSMGGLIGRYAAAAAPEGDDYGRRLRVRRLFTIASPHRGAKLAGLPTLDEKQKDMRSGSEFLTQLDDSLETSDYELIPYVRLGDSIVGTENAAPYQDTPYWVPIGPLEMAHLFSWSDPRIMADIMRQLRGETPFIMGPPAPLPE